MKHRRNREQYLTIATPMVKAMELKEGDIVRVTRKASSGELGWDNCWTESMNASIGLELEVRDGEDTGPGIALSDGYWHPIFILEKIKESSKITIKNVTPDYDAVINTNGTIMVGCQKVDFKKLEELYNLAKSRQN